MTTLAPILRPLGHLLAAEERAVATPIVYRVCAWCQRGMGVALAVLREAGSTSHGVCPDCKEKFMAKIPAGNRPSCRGGAVEVRG